MSSFNTCNPENEPQASSAAEPEVGLPSANIESLDGDNRSSPITAFKRFCEFFEKGAFGSLKNRKLIVGLFVVIVFAHIYKIADLPMGLYLDESSIALNAATIANDGVDEYGKRWPIYFTAFGENKNPTYIYVNALFFKVFGISNWTLRFTSAFFYLVALGIFYFLLKTLFSASLANSSSAHPNNNAYRGLPLFGIACFGFLPYFFTISRISFELISQLSWLAAILLCSYYYLKSDKTKQQMIYAVFCGLLIGTSIYSYSTARLLSLIMLLSLGTSIFRYRYNAEKWEFKFDLTRLYSLIVVGVFFSIALIPYLIFALDNPDGLTGRFYSLSYVDDAIPLVDKLFLFFKNYVSYWGPKFLLYDAEWNPRHTTGFGGAIFVSVWVLGIIGGIGWIKTGELKRNTYIRFLFLSWLAAPMAASLIDQLHLLRSMTSGVYWIIAACYGLAYLLSALQSQYRRIAYVFVSVFLIFEVSLYLSHYFVVFPERSLHGSESYGALAAYKAAVKQNPQRIIFLANPHASYATMRFNQFLVESDIPVKIVKTHSVTVQRDECVIYHKNSERNVRTRAKETFRLAGRLDPNYLQRMLGVRPADYFTRVKCY